MIASPIHTNACSRSPRSSKASRAARHAAEEGKIGRLDAGRGRSDGRFKRHFLAVHHGLGRRERALETGAGARAAVFDDLERGTGAGDLQIVAQ
jgi:hypothetical protein